MSNAYEQYNTQQELGRIQRRAHGADTTRDDAQVRHEAIMGWVLGLHPFGPIIIAALVGWISTSPAGGWGFCVGGAAVWMSIAGLIAGGANLFLGAFVENVVFKTFHGVLRIGGAVMIVVGLFYFEIGAILTGVGMIAYPTVWTKWARKVTNNTDFAIMEREEQAIPAVPRIVE